MPNSTYSHIYSLATAIVETAPNVTEQMSDDYFIEPPGQVVVRFVELSVNGERIQIGLTTESAKGEFDWAAEITSDIGQSDRIKHYLLMHNGTIMHAIRRTLTPVDDTEAQTIIADLEQALETLK